MKPSFLLSLASLATALPKAVSTAASTFASIDGLQFNIDGKSGYYAGSNSYWIGFLANSSDVDLVFDHMNDSGLKVLRVWGFNDVNSKPTDGSVWFQMHANGTSTINTGEDGLQRLDYVVSSAEEHGIKLIITFVNNWSDYGGMQAYLTAYGGGEQKSWYNNTQIQQAYQKYISTVVSRYVDSSAVFAWELANEPRCNGCDTGDHRSDEHG